MSLQKERQKKKKIHVNCHVHSLRKYGKFKPQRIECVLTDCQYVGKIACHHVENKTRDAKLGRLPSYFT